MQFDDDESLARIVLPLLGKEIEVATIVASLYVLMAARHSEIEEALGFKIALDEMTPEKWEKLVALTIGMVEKVFSEAQKESDGDDPLPVVKLKGDGEMGAEAEDQPDIEEIDLNAPLPEGLAKTGKISIRLFQPEDFSKFDLSKPAEGDAAAEELINHYLDAIDEAAEKGWMSEYFRQSLRLEVMTYLDPNIAAIMATYLPEPGEISNHVAEAQHHGADSFEISGLISQGQVLEAFLAAVALAANVLENEINKARYADRLKGLGIH